ncbi:peptidoglycan-binding protein [Streptomyces sp. NPDC088253]|uniref:peptidoglycan-binding domain-containing protein n=1 Tax=Streptomyces sp. NPDC088253 TaxID=3365846 RepID=UPI00381D3676
MSVRDLSETVGEGGVNDLDDVFTVQMLLNQVDSAAGGPSPLLDVDGLVGPKTIGAIRWFQNVQLGFQDGLVEPGKVTFNQLKGFFRSPDAFPDPLVAGDGAVKPHRLVYRDVRLIGNRPAGDTVIEVDVNTPLQWFLDSSADTVAHTADRVRLKLMAHGAPAFVQFCKENLFTANLPLLAVLKDKFAAGVDLYSCSAAFIGPGSSDGNVFCYSMAKILNTYVRASTAKQLYSPGAAGSGLDFGRWEGTVLTYDPTGRVVNVENSPQF